MAKALNGKKVAILVANGFEQAELTEPKRALEDAGAQVTIVSPEHDQVKGWIHPDWGDMFKVDLQIERADASDFDALVLPGGVQNPDHLRRLEAVQHFVRAFFEAGKPVAAICHAAWTLIDAGVVEGRTLTSYHSLQTDLRNAGAHWVDQEVVVDNGLVTSRDPDDLPAFNRKLLEEIAEGRHARQATLTSSPRS
ncbi:type 1 glutamine amidotransferase domain-containing protein [Aggregatilinea lenta]|uniref:type 1 glutamine amidotransferase domain-containing protein n=1 Tax=Aggregatilinea lenta TaxID=913108 RepID=UPI000E5B2021|nr:type 1 glutamine amidotransferase domain-containing protein [Aggregatilinea lenta]